MEIQWYCPPEVGALARMSISCPEVPRCLWTKTASYWSQLAHCRKNSYAANEREKIAIDQPSGASTRHADGSTRALETKMTRTTYLVKPSVKTLNMCSAKFLVVLLLIEAVSHINSASQVIKMVQVKPKIEINVNRRLYCQHDRVRGQDVSRRIDLQDRLLP